MSRKTLNSKHMVYLNITYKGKPVFFPAWAKSGLHIVICVNDVINANGFITWDVKAVHVL